MHQVRLVPYNPDFLDESVLWTESRDVGHGFRCVRMVNNIYLNFDAFHGDKDHGGVHDGTTVVLWEWAKGDNQRWKILPWCKCSNNISCLPCALLYIILGEFISFFHHHQHIRHRMLRSVGSLCPRMLRSVY
jgi:hypothetical protein